MAGFDFYSMARLIEAMDNATLDDYKRNLETCEEFGSNLAYPAGKRRLWKEFAKLLRHEIKQF